MKERLSKGDSLRRGLLFFSLGIVIAVVVLGATSIKTTDNIETEQQLVSNALRGTPPLVVQSVSRVTNLNADKVDGFDASSFALASNTYTMAEIDALLAEQYVPFMARTGGSVTCAQVNQQDSDWLVIDSTGTAGDFLVTSVTFSAPVGTTQTILASSDIRVRLYCVDYDVFVNGCYTIETVDFASTHDPGGFEVLGAPTQRTAKRGASGAVDV